MNLALAEARLAAEEEEVPVGAVVVVGSRLAGRGHNRMRALNDPTAHAEILAITAACQSVEAPRLDGADLYVTLEPCAMCAGAMVLARIARVHYGAADPRTGACGSIFDIVREPRLNHRLEVYPSVLGDEATQLLESFFQDRRS